MAVDLFQQALEFTLGQEGGWADNPADPGGPTMYGITLAVFQAWRHDSSLGAKDLSAITPTEVAAIYRALYWNPVAAAHLMPGVGLSVFDAAVNLGVRRAALLLQGTVGVARDGAIGPATLNAASKGKPGDLLTKLASGREAFYRCCARFSLFGAGWLSRNNACLFAARKAAGVMTSTIVAETGRSGSAPAQSPADALNEEELGQVATLS